jgi:hypothetical protein
MNVYTGAFWAWIIIAVRPLVQSQSSLEATPPLTHCFSLFLNACVMPAAWVWNCVGQNNQKYFFLFLVYSWMGSFYGLVMMSFPFAELFIYKVTAVSRRVFPLPTPHL